MMDSFDKQFWTFGTIAGLISLGLLGFVVWVVVKLLQHFGVV